MKNNEFHEQILRKLDDLDQKVDGVRTQDIPALQTTIAGFRSEIDTLKSNQTWATRLYTIIGGAITVAIVKFTGHH